MFDLGVLRELGTAVLGAAGVLAVARAVRLPPLLGYLIAGLLLGPAAGVLEVTESLDLFSHLGVALLLFLRWLQQPKSFLLLLIGHCVLTLPYVLLVVQARLVGIKRSYEEASKTLGANPLHTFREVTFPLLTPAILAGMLFSFSISFDDVTATLFWATAQNQTVPVKIFAMLRNNISPEINALGTIMIVLTVSIPLVAGYLGRKFARGK